jgi:hypothetical protein
MVGLHDSGINLLGHHLEPDVLPEWGMVLLQKAAPAGDGLDHPLALELRVGLGHRVPVNAQLLGERPNGGQRLARPQCPRCRR